MLRTIEAEHRAGRFDGVALIANDRHIIAETAVGMADRTFSVPHRIDEPMPIASVTKQFVAVGIMRLVQAGRLNLDAPVGRHLSILNCPWATIITPRQLLQHRSGLPQPDAVIPGFYARTDLPSDALSMAKVLGECDLTFEPGSRFEYNNTDYVLLGAILAAAHGKPLGEVLAQEIFIPAGMSNSGLITDRRVIPRLPPSYDLDAGPEAPARFPPHQELANYGGAGAAYSTARDLMAFDRALMNDVLLDRPTREAMFESSPQSGYAALGCWVYALDLPAHGAVRVVERHGAIAGYNVVNLIAPDHGVCVILFCNISSFAEPQTWGSQGLAFQLLEKSFGQPELVGESPRSN